MVATHAIDHSGLTNAANTVSAVGIDALNAAAPSNVVEDRVSSFLGGYDVLVRATNVQDCIES